MASNVYQMPPPPMGRAGTTFPTTSGTWAWNGGTQQWTVLPSGTSQVYGWDGTSQSWVPVTGGGSTVGDRQGVTDGSNAAPGMIGEMVEGINNTTGVTLTAGTWGTGAASQSWLAVTSFTLSAGDWDVSATVEFGSIQGGAPTTAYTGWGNIGTSVGVLPGNDWLISGGYTASFNNENAVFIISPHRRNLTAATTLYLSVAVSSQAAVDVGKPIPAWGHIYARRMR